MLSSLASYLLGGGAAAAEPRCPAEAEAPPAHPSVSAVDADDGWVLVDSLESGCDIEGFTDVRLVAGAAAAAGGRGRRRGSRAEQARSPTPPRADGGVAEAPQGDAAAGAGAGAPPRGPALGSDSPVVLRSRSSSSASLPCLRVDESWYVTPPPCFTSTGPVHMETSPLEDLLIEHPSMSVYCQHPSAAPSPAPSLTPAPAPAPAPSPERVRRQRQRADSLPPPAPAPAPAPQAAAAVAAPARAAAAPAGRGGGAGALRVQEQQVLQLKAAQKVQQRRASQNLKRGPLERHNKARECNARNKVLRRSDRMLQHSGANNNRKC